MAKVLVLYYSDYGHIEKITVAFTEGARRSVDPLPRLSEDS